MAQSLTKGVEINHSPAAVYIWVHPPPQTPISERLPKTVSTDGPGCRTTGASKLAERSHYALIGNILATLHHYTLRPRLREIIFCNYKFCGMGFLTLGLLIPLKARYKSVFPFPLEAGAGARRFVDSVKRWKPSWVMAPKHLMRETLAMQDVTREDLESVQHVLTGGAIIPWELVEEWQGRFGSQVQSTYGMTEYVYPSLVIDFMRF